MRFYRDAQAILWVLKWGGPATKEQIDTRLRATVSRHQTKRILTAMRYAGIVQVVQTHRGAIWNLPGQVVTIPDRTPGSKLARIPTVGTKERGVSWWVGAPREHLTALARARWRS